MIELARSGADGKPVSLDAVGRKTGVSRRYLEQLAIGLKQAGLVRGVSGRRGGYVLQRAASDIRVGDIVEAAIGPVSIVDCVASPEWCLKSDTCECRAVYSLINRQITQVLNGYSLADMADREWLRRTRQDMGAWLPGPGGPKAGAPGGAPCGLGCPTQSKDTRPGDAHGE